MSNQRHASRTVSSFAMDRELLEAWRSTLASKSTSMSGEITKLAKRQTRKARKRDEYLDSRVIDSFSVATALLNEELKKSGRN